MATFDITIWSHYHHHHCSFKETKILFTHKSKRKIKQLIQKAFDNIVEFCKKWGFKINRSKTCYSVFTTAGLRNNYQRKYSIKLKIENQEIPLESTPTFLGIKLDPKLKYNFHFNEIVKKVSPKFFEKLKDSNGETQSL